MKDLLATPCWALAAGENEDVTFDSALSLKSWWDAGGSSWVSHYLTLGAPGHHPNNPNWSMVAPTPRKTLTRESAKDSPLASILCSARDASCGLETRGWLTRARQAFEAHAREKRREPRPSDPRAVCTERAKNAPAGDGYDTWRRCLDDTAERSDALPLGRFRAPTDGWLVLRGRRGHYALCDEVRAYDLATGSAFVSGTCGGLVLRDGGSVDGQKTDATRKLRSEVGRLPLENLREAALLTLLAPHVQHDVLAEGFGWALPDDLPIQSSTDGVFGGLALSGGFSSGQTIVGWAWVRSGRAVASGELVWPENYNDAASDHAVKLLQIAEAAFAPSECVPAAPPSPLPSGDKAPGVAKIDGHLDSRVSGPHALDALRGRVCPPGHH